ncbi:hypothetical protein CVIRNUC_003334 [Coccomyxa viridis]|uniref:Uncharacterized protein n=1 Tax=Coccomyxa viridis TaxID=1274662 RepID=A0AAV1HZD6_9CHLO|nr:hypothetical protein CVIRNUC_003334 [Coccomyxa viridis]
MTTEPTVDSVIGDIDDRLRPTGDVHRKFAEAVRRLLITRAWSMATEATLFSPQQFQRLKGLVECGETLPHDDKALLERVLLYRCWTAEGNGKIKSLTKDRVLEWFEQAFKQEDWKVPSLPTAEELALSTMKSRELSEAFRDTLLKAQQQYKALQKLHQEGITAIEKSLTKLDSSILHRKEIPPKEKTLWGRLWDL